MRGGHNRLQFILNEVISGRKANMAGEFTGKVVMVTGANGNIGQAVARRFAGAGARVVVVGRKPEELDAIGKEVNGIVGVADVTDPSSIAALMEKLESGQIKVDVLAHTVGGFAAGQPVHESALDAFDKMMTLNARSVWVTCGRVAKHMVDNHVEGRIVAILSKNAYKGGAKSAAYSASKAAAQRILESMAAELAASGIRVNGIVPSMIDTPQNRGSSPNADYSKWVQPDEIADAILFLSSDKASSINGVSLDIFGRA
jgi:NAD(P)-dependent dehydrogenase (short-subunit alcohol dehydrogenase family)